MSTAALNLPYTPQLDSGAIRSFVFAVMVHGALFGFLYFGVRWQSETPLPIEAELWTAVPSAPAPVPKADTPRVEVKPEPKPEVVEPPKPAAKPDIAEKIEKKPEPKKVEPKPRVEVDPIKRDLIKEQINKELQRDNIAQAAAKDAAAGAGRENQNWLRAINAHIKRNFVFADTSVSPGIEARFEVTLAKSLAILNVRLIKPSGNSGFDAAALRAIEASSPLPAPMSSAVDIPRTIEVPMRPEKK